jgi:hypothetical protein
MPLQVNCGMQAEKLLQFHPKVLVHTQGLVCGAMSATLPYPSSTPSYMICIV